MNFNRELLRDLPIGFIVIVYTYSFMDKVLNHEQFTLNLLSSPLIAMEYVGFLQYVVPAAELLVLIGILVFTRKSSTYHYTFFLSAVFTTYFILFFLITQNSKCGCGKLIESLGFLPHLFLINLPLILCSALLIFYCDKSAARQEAI